MLRHAISGVAVFMAAAGILSAQNFPQPGPEHKELHKLEGTWDAVMKMNGTESKCIAIYKPICGGMWMASDFEGDLGGLKFQGHGLDGYDQNKKKFVGVWVDSMSTAPMHMEGNYDEETKLLVMTGESTGPDGKPQKFKTTTETRDKDHFTFTMSMIGPNGQEQPTFTIDYSRRK